MPPARHSETRTHDTLLQLTHQVVRGVVDMQYVYPTAQNNGRITSSISAPCQDALGAHWNLFNGSSSLLGKVDQASPNHLNFYDGTSGVIQNTHMSDWGWTDNADWTVAQVFSVPGVYGFTSEYAGEASNDIVLGGYFFSHPEIQGAGMLHELLHAYTGMKDIDLAGTLGFGRFDSVQDASGAITNYLSKDCSRGII